MNFRKILRAIFMIVLVSCGQNNESNAADTELNYREINELLKVVKNPKEFYEIEYYCKKTGGTFLKERPACLCPVGKNFQGFGRPGCYKYEIKELFLEGRKRLLTSSISKSSFPIDVSSWLTGSTNNNSIQLISQLWKPYVHVPEVVPFTEITLKHIKKALGFFQITDNIESLSTFTDVLNPIFIGQGTLPLTLVNRYDESINFAQINKHLPSFEINTNDISKINLLKWKVQSYHPRKCLVHCELTKEMIISNFLISIKKIIRGGQVFRAYLAIRDQDTYQNQYFIPLGSNNEIQVVMKLDEKKVRYQNEEKIIKNIFVYHEKKLRKFEWDLINQLTQKNKVYQEDEDVYEWGKDSSKILLCDSDVQIEQLNWANKHKIYFPNQAKDRGQFNLFHKDFNSLDGYMYSSNINRNGVHHTNGEGHSDSLLRFADNGTIIPIALYPCLLNIQEWKQGAKNENVRVVNLSAADEIFDYKACEEQEYTKNIKNNGGDFMWVMAAGNKDVEVDKFKSSSCPQKALLESENVLIVSRKGRTHGANFVDIMISRNQNGYSQSSSESTIIMSQQIAQLFHEFPNSTPEMMKKAIIVGAKFDDKQSHLTRAGGTFSYHNSKKVLEELSRNPRATLERLVKKVTWRWDERAEKINHLKKHYQQF